MKFKRVLTYYEQREGETCPKWYGQAYRDFASRSVICYPMPFHLIVRYLRPLYFRFRSLLSPSFPESLLREADKKGYDRGYACGFKLGEQSVWAHVTKTRNPFDEVAAKFIVAEPEYKFAWQDPGLNQHFGNGGFEAVLVNGHRVEVHGLILVRKLWSRVNRQKAGEYFEVWNA